MERTIIAKLLETMILFTSITEKVLFIFGLNLLYVLRNALEEAISLSVSSGSPEFVANNTLLVSHPELSVGSVISPLVHKTLRFAPFPLGKIIPIILWVKKKYKKFYTLGPITVRQLTD